MMPGEDGLTILRSLDRATASAIIILSVIGAEVDKIVDLGGNSGLRICMTSAAR